MSRSSRSHQYGSFVVAAEAPADRAAIRYVHETAFGRADEADIVDRVRRGDRFVPAWSLIARTGSTVVGHALFSYIDLDRRSGHVGTRAPNDAGMGTVGRVVALGPIGVLPSRQRTGAARALIEAGIARVSDAAEPAIAVLGDPSLYGRFGFVPAGTFGVEPTWAEMMLLDLGGAERLRGGTVVYPDEFSGPGRTSNP